MRSTFSILLLLLFDCYVLLTAFLNERNSSERTIVPTLLFFCSGMPALIYQIVWQRALFAIYGVNSESVAVVVSAFMIGLGLGSLLGGWLSTKLPGRAILIFGAAELGAALFGLISLRLFHWVSQYSAGASLPVVIFLSLALLLFPTVCMGATLPLLADYLVSTSRTVGYSVGILYFANAFGSAVACFLCATFLMRDFGQSGSVRVAACINILVAVATLLFVRVRPQPNKSSVAPVGTPESPALSISVGALLAGCVGFISLGFEIVWFRVFVLASSDRAPAFALLLSTFLAGVAAGAFIAGKLTCQLSAPATLRGLANLLFAAAAIACYLSPLVAWLTGKGLNFLIASPAFFLVAALLGAVFTLVCKLAIPASSETGRSVSLIYVGNIAGSASGSLLVGFVLMDHLGLVQVTWLLSAAASFIGALVLLKAWILSEPIKFHPVGPLIGASLLTLILGPFIGFHIHERMILHSRWKTTGDFAQIVENRNGVIAVQRDGEVFGNGVHDGFFSIDPVNDKNFIVRAYAVAAFHSAPKRILMIGLSSGSWAQVLVNHPTVESLEIVEINPGYLRLIPQWAAVRSILKNPKIQMHIDDGRRWLLAHPDLRYDVIVQNTSFFWRDHTSELLSADYLRIIRRHLAPGGAFYYNTTGSDDVVATGLSVFPFGLRVLNFLAVSDAPLIVDKLHWASILRDYSVDGRLVFDANLPSTSALIAEYMALADSVTQPQIAYGMEDSNSMRARLKDCLIITDDNMGWEWREINLGD